MKHPKKLGFSRPLSSQGFHVGATRTEVAAGTSLLAHSDVAAAALARASFN
jgi:hypothetical protein